MAKLTFLITLPLLLCIVFFDVSAQPTTAMKLGGAFIPASFVRALNDGLSIPVQLRHNDSITGVDTILDESIGSAILALKDMRIHLIKLDLFDSKQFSSELISKLTAENSELIFDDNGYLAINNDANMQLDLISMNLIVNVFRGAFNQTLLDVGEREELTPTVNNVSSVHSYNVGYSFNGSKVNFYDSNFFQLNSLFGIGADHFQFDGALYNIGEGGQAGDIYRVMYERDLNGKRIAAGMISSWDLQTLGTISTLNYSRIYGLSYGNATNSNSSNKNESTTPVRVFMPANGEVRLYRNDRMLAIFNLPIGNQYIDTSSLPSGIYDIVVEIFVDGRSVDKSTQRITKIGGDNRFAHSLGWQFWGGWMQSSLEEQSSSPLAGFSLSRKFNELNLSTTNYTYNDVLVGESSLQWQPSTKIRLGTQTMLSTDGSFRVANNINFQAADNISLWARQEKSTRSCDKKEVSETDQVLFGLNFNIGGWVNNLGSLSFNAVYNNIESNSSYIDYAQNLYSGKYGNLSLHTSLHSSDGIAGNFDNKSIRLEYSIPIKNDFSLAFSGNEQGEAIIDIGYRKYLDGFIDNASINIQKSLSNESATALSGSIGFRQSYMSGTASLSRSSDGGLNGNVVSRGTIATSGMNFSASKQGNGRAGVLVNTGIINGGQILAKIDGRDYELKNAKTFIPLSPYRGYEIEFLNSKVSLDTYEINSGKQLFTLFPGNVANLDVSESIRELVTVFGIIRAEDGSLLTNARIDNHIGTALTNDSGEFSMDIDKSNPTITFKYGSSYCEAAVDIRNESGAVWLGEITCNGLSSYASLAKGV
ncbi:CS1-pili formation C-terminal domain-containing protein [Aeromonas sp. A5]|uniref:CS1-pili formation C-terminal domain-containing protein n=1 Tax=unclassified Aeromonas TaxID=257493 RepID=UPI0037706D89